MSLRPVLIAGPTASGKSALAVRLAEERGGVVINADSMQVYDTLRVLTARPDDEDLARAPHVLYGHVAASHAYSVAQWLADVRQALADVEAAGRVAIVVGGTGLYFKALLEGLSPVPPVPDDVRRHWRAAAARIGAPALHAQLSARDPVMADRLRPSDPQRIVRALEVLEATGRSLADWQALPGEPVVQAGEAELICLRPERTWLQARCDARFEQMIARGAVDEVRALADQGLDETLPVFGALGVRPLMRMIRGKTTLAEAIGEGKMETRRYLKRQWTWQKRHMMAWNDV